MRTQLRTKSKDTVHMARWIRRWHSKAMNPALSWSQSRRNIVWETFRRQGLCNKSRLAISGRASALPTMQRYVNSANSSSRLTKKPPCSSTPMTASSFRLPIATDASVVVFHNMGCRALKSGRIYLGPSFHRNLRRLRSSGKMSAYTSLMTPSSLAICLSTSASCSGYPRTKCVASLPACLTGSLKKGTGE